jgi:hypothetical protein
MDTALPCIDTICFPYAKSMLLYVMRYHAVLCCAVLGRVNWRGLGCGSI